jgi:hypothetical protein
MWPKLDMMRQKQGCPRQSKMKFDERPYQSTGSVSTTSAHAGPQHERHAVAKRL